MRSRTRLVVLALITSSLAATPARAAGPYLAGSYSTPIRAGTITYRPLRAVIQFGSEGRFVIDGKGYPGALYAIRGTPNIGLVWYYGTSGNSAGSAVLSPTGGGNYSGAITFTDRRGNITDTGTVNAAITVK